MTRRPTSKTCATYPQGSVAEQVKEETEGETG